MTPKNPLAFPVPASDVKNVFGEQKGNRHQRGMTLRDYFAAKAMQALIIKRDGQEDFGSDVCAFSAYVFADEMLEARSK